MCRRFLIGILPAAVVAPLYFNGEIEFGVVNQSSSAFNHILNDVSLVVFQVWYQATVLIKPDSEQRPCSTFRHYLACVFSSSAPQHLRRHTNLTQCTQFNE